MLLSTESARKGSSTRGGVVVTRNHASRWTWARSYGWVATQHSDARAVLGTAKRDHVLADVAAHNVAVLRAAVGQDVLDEVVSKLVPSN